MTFRLSGNQLTSIPVGTIVRLRFLQILDLSNNPDLGGTLPAPLPTSLAHLNLCCNPAVRGTLPTAYALLSEENRANQPTDYQDLGMMQAGETYLTFWQDHGDELRQRFASFAAR